MHPIVSQSGQVTYSPWPLLAAPPIAGLLAATSVTSPPPPKPLPEITYRNPILGDLPAERRAQFVEAATILLDVAVAFAHGDMNENALRAAQVLFHRQLTGHSRNRPLNPVAYRAERDADLLDWWVGASRWLTASEAASQQRIADIERRWAARHSPVNGSDTEVTP